MFDIKWIRENPAAFDAGLDKRGVAPLSQNLIDLDKKRRASQTQAQEIKAARNQISKQIGAAKAKGEDAAALIASGVIRRERDGVSLLSNGDLTTKLDIHVYRASKGAVEAVEKSGGTLKTDYVAKRKRERGGK